MVVAGSIQSSKRSEGHLPNLLNDLTAIVDSQSQVDPQFRATRLYTRLSAAEVRRQLIVQKGYSQDELPTAETIATKLNALGYYPKKVAKSQLTPCASIAWGEVYSPDLPHLYRLIPRA